MKDDNKSLFLSKLSCSIKDFRPEILEILNAQTKGKLFTKFVENFLKYIPIDYHSKAQMQIFGDFTDEAFSFFQSRPKNERKIEIVKSEYKKNPAITIHIATDNRPFIVDSLNWLFSSLALHTVFTLHPVICTKRSADGKLLDIMDHNDNKCKEEALIFVKALGKFDSNTLKQIKKEIGKILDLIDYTYDSWHTLLNKLINITTDISHNQQIYNDAKFPTNETLDFLNWLQKDNFTFLGMVNFDTTSLELTETEGVQEIWHNNINEIKTIIQFSNSKEYTTKLSMLGKINTLSPVHRHTLVDYILIKKLDKDGVYRSGTIIFGLYGTAIYFQSIKNVPILRGKMNYVIERSAFPLNGYNAKKIKNIIESLPRDILIQIDESDLYCMCLHMLSSMRSHILKVFIQQDWSSSFVNVIVFMQRDKLTPDAYKAISSYLSEKFGSEIIADKMAVVAQEFANYFATLAVSDASKLDINYQEIQAELTDLTTNWSENLYNKLSEKYGEYDGGKIFKKFEHVFPVEYRHKFNANETIDDIYYLSQAITNNQILFNLTQKDQTHFAIKIYSPKIDITLSEMLPAIENMGFSAIDEQSFSIKRSNDQCQSWIYLFRLSSPVDITEHFALLKDNVENTLYKISTGALTSDELCKLVVYSNLTWRQVKLLRALTRYMHQIFLAYGHSYVNSILVKHYLFSRRLIDFFEAKFDPKKQKHAKINKLAQDIKQYIDNVEISTEDKILSNMFVIIDAITRTNYYQHHHKEEKEYLSFKFDCSKIPNLPKPIPYFEIFVYSNHFEGIHLRGGSVARGGLRWSDRCEDYRTEVLGLMKAQMTKNPVIVPVGAKGAFYVNIDNTNISHEEYMQQVVSCYQNFLRGLLDITDNIINDKIVKSKNTITYDKDDPYLVVAADKGTATFSDYANEIAAEYKFWLADAFASGGSSGYDHKKMGITAKGAWVSVISHLSEMGINPDKDQFTAVGIGDMSGDVFGNGMLLSKHIRLVAAFNHKHIFIDPNPDPAVSFQERKRLFKLPRSNWTDYNTNLLSKGGDIFNRAAKKLTISSEVQKLLDITTNHIAPDELIKAILKAEVDLLWNGGIGTYIKGSNETHSDIGDKHNDAVRCNGGDIRAKIIAEGGNLGISQLGRIEYALAGGKINTDFIDNSAGVDCSDHEVNIKIALNHAYFENKISLNQRNGILKDMTDDIERLVLIDNYYQNQAISIAEKSHIMNIEIFSQLIYELEKNLDFERKEEFLPNKTELSRRKLNNEKITRPELAILLSYTKMYVDKALSSASLIDDPFFNKYLFYYFPEKMHSKFKDEIINHPLRNEIVRTYITNKMVNQLGAPLISVIKRETGAELCDIARAYTVICNTLELDELWRLVEKLDDSIDTAIKMELFTAIIKIIQKGTCWIIRNIPHPINIEETILEYSKPLKDLAHNIHKSFIGDSKEKFEAKLSKYKNGNVKHKLAQEIALLEILASVLDITYIAKLTKNNNEDIAKLYFQVGELFKIDWLRKSCDMLTSDSYWNRLSIQTLKDDFYDKQKRLLIKILSKPKNKTVNLLNWMEKNDQTIKVFTNFIDEIKSQEKIDLNIMILANNKFEMFLRKLGE